MTFGCCRASVIKPQTSLPASEQRHPSIPHHESSHNGLTLGAKRRRYVPASRYSWPRPNWRDTDPAAGAAPLLRPTIARHVLPALASAASARNASGVPAEEPKKKAQSIIDSLPGSSLLSKSAILSSAAGISVYAISNEYYVMNEETVVAFCLLAVWGGLIKYGGPAYKEWAEGQNEKIKNILNSARADHTEAVQTRIEGVKQMGGVVDITKNLFAVSKVSG